MSIANLNALRTAMKLDRDQARQIEDDERYQREKEREEAEWQKYLDDPRTKAVNETLDQWAKETDLEKRAALKLKLESLWMMNAAPLAKEQSTKTDNE